jgi:hypothetical protein
VNGKASRQRKERQARDKAVDWQEVSKKRGRRKKHRGSDTMSCDDRVEEAARADCGTRQGAGSSQKHGLERWRQQAKRPLCRPSIQGRVPACALLDLAHGATGGERTCSRSTRGEEAGNEHSACASCQRRARSCSAAIIAAEEAQFRLEGYFRRQRALMPCIAGIAPGGCR